MKEDINEPYDYKSFYIDFEKSHCYFGGLIYDSDYNIGWDGKKTKVEKESKWAKRIAFAENFNAACSSGQKNYYLIKKNKGGRE